LSKLNINQINQRLRKIGEPIILFGEALADRIARLAVALTRYYNQEGKDEDRTRTGNLYKDKDNTESSKSKVLITNKNDNDNDDSDDNNSIADDKNDKKHKTYDPNIKYSEMKDLSSEVIVYKYFKSILKAWARNLDSRPDIDKATAKGKIDTSTQKQCKDYVRPLFKMCKKKNVPPDILMKLVEMVRFCENGDFRSANDKYLRTAIGNAAWPMGLNGVSIHQRAAQDNVGKSNIAHVMNNEIQRKYLTSVKRLMTYAQDLRDDVPPSMKVL
jgi:pre-mRNA-splicing factor 18